MDNNHAVSEATQSAASGRSHRLRATLALTRGRLTELIHRVWYHPRLGELYPEFLFAMLGAMQASVPVMRVAADRSAKLQDDHLSGTLRDYFAEHAEEEEGHEEWLLADLASMGIGRDRALERLPYPSVAALVGTQYYWIEHAHPAAFLGYLAVLEQPAETGFLKEVHERTGIPLSSMSCHIKHAELDPGHVAEFDTLLDKLPLTRQQEELITVSAITTIGHLEMVFTDLVEHFGRISNPALHDTIFIARETTTGRDAVILSSYDSSDQSRR